jgi:hypothetical protein
MFRICCCALPLLVLSIGATNEQNHARPHEDELERMTDVIRRYKEADNAEELYVRAWRALDEAFLVGDEKEFQKKFDAFRMAAEAYRLAVTTYRKALDETVKPVQGKNADKLDAMIKELETSRQRTETIRKHDYAAFLAKRELQRKLEEIDFVKRLLLLRMK